MKSYSVTASDRFISTLWISNTEMEAATLEKINENLEDLKREVAEIRLNMIDIDSILTPEEQKELEASRKNYKQGKTTDFDELKRELGP